MPDSAPASYNAPITRTGLVDRLAAHASLGAVPRQELEWLASHGALRHLNTGETLSSKGVKVAGLFVILSGRIAIFLDRGAGLQKTLEWREGDVAGMLPYSRLVSPPGDTIAQEPTLVLAIACEHLRDMIRECHETTTLLVHKMVDRARAFTSSDLHQEKMVSLGKLSAGLAHELNNPVAAIERGAALLTDRLEESERASRALGASPLTSSQLAAVEGVRELCATTRPHGLRSPIEEAEREEAIEDWLVDHGLDSDIAGALAETPATFASLDLLAQAVQGPPLNAVLRWAAAGCSVRGIASEIQDAAMRISGLVTAIKGFTHMDQATVAEPVDLLSGLRNTILVLKSKARTKSITVALDVEAGLPRVRGFAGELNQIWANLIDNALDAVPDAGRVDVLVRRDGERVAVHILDNGTGIPARIRDRIFEPFFSTKPVGLGTGLGLDIVRRLVQHNDGEIAVESQPGCTEFRVILPLATNEGTN
jgi:signal transduction histidine kinase